MNNLLIVKNLSVARGERFTLRVGEIKLKAGTITCLTGPNGSGKTTLVECLTGLITPDRGDIVISGRSLSSNLYETKAVVGFVPDDEDWFIKELSAWEYFRLLGGIYKEAGVTANTGKRLGELAGALHFTAFTQPLVSLSHGNKKKVQIIAALMHRPKVIIVDELRNGLDPLAIIAAERLIREQAEQGACIVAATHDLWWAERVAHEVIMLMNGTVRVHAKTAQLVRRHGSLEALFRKTAADGN
jgi:ABC-2 type transport system ATP-binding protein